MNEHVINTAFQYVPLMLAAAVLAWTALRMDRKVTHAKLFVLGGCLLIPFVPISDIDLTEYTYSAIGHSSITSTLLLAAFLYQKAARRSLLVSGELTILALIISVGSALLYASAFGLVGLNIFELGFGSLILFSLLLAVNVLLFGFGKYFAGCLVSLTVIAYNLNFLDSLNYWDYFTDPSVALFSVIWLLCKLYRSLSGQKDPGVNAKKGLA